MREVLGAQQMATTTVSLHIDLLKLKRSFSDGNISLYSFESSGEESVAMRFIERDRAPRI